MIGTVWQTRFSRSSISRGDICHRFGFFARRNEPVPPKTLPYCPQPAFRIDRQPKSTRARSPASSLQQVYLVPQQRNESRRFSLMQHRSRLDLIVLGMLCLPKATTKTHHAASGMLNADLVPRFYSEQLPAATYGSALPRPFFAIVSVFLGVFLGRDSLSGRCSV